MFGTARCSRRRTREAGECTCLRMQALQLPYRRAFRRFRVLHVLPGAVHMKLYKYEHTSCRKCKHTSCRNANTRAVAMRVRAPRLPAPAEPIKHPHLQSSESVLRVSPPSQPQSSESVSPPSQSSESVFRVSLPGQSSESVFRVSLPSQSSESNQSLSASLTWIFAHLSRAPDV